jgi:homoserine O-acetyltransferase
MGGMQVLQFAANFPSRYDVFFACATTANTSPGTVALRSVQRAAVRNDPAFRGGEYEVNPTAGMGIARMFGTPPYRSPFEFNNRFDWAPTVMESGEVSFEVERYLQHQAVRFTKGVNYDANCYLLLSQAMDLMDIGQGVGSYEAGVERIPCGKSGMLLSYSTDLLTPPEDLQRFASALGKTCVPVHFEVLDSPLGHDAFLVESGAQPINVRLKTFLEAGKDAHVDEVRRLVKEMFEH